MFIINICCPSPTLLIHFFSVFDGWGTVKSKPIHIVVPDAYPNVDFTMDPFKWSGFEGYLQTFLPPQTSSCPESRRQQTVGLVAFTGLLSLYSNPVQCFHFAAQHYHRLIVDQNDACPGLMVASVAPEVRHYMPC